MPISCPNNLQKAMTENQMLGNQTFEFHKSSHLFVIVVAEWRLLGNGAVPFTVGLLQDRVSGDKVGN